MGIRYPLINKVSMAAHAKGILSGRLALVTGININMESNQVFSFHGRPCFKYYYYYFYYDVIILYAKPYVLWFSCMHLCSIPQSSFLEPLGDFEGDTCSNVALLLFACNFIAAILVVYN